MNTLDKYLNTFQKLRIDRAHGIAPHKPILLISVLQSFQNKSITTNRIYITPELVALFKANWSLLVSSKHDCKFSLPFFYLTSDKFWRLVPKSGYENLIKFSASMRSFVNLNVAVDYAIIEKDLFLLLTDKRNISILINFLLDNYFPDTKGNFKNSIKKQYDLFNELEIKILENDPEEYSSELKSLIKNKEEEEIFLRSNIFKREIPKIYNYTCCISRMRVDTINDISMIDACHIKPFSLSYNDTISNGIALCPNLHRAFDRGLITIDDRFRVIVSGAFKENKSDYSIRKYNNQEIILPNDSTYYPSQLSLEWHWQNRFIE